MKEEERCNSRFSEAPKIVTDVPGPKASKLLKRAKVYEPMVLEKSQVIYDMTVWQSAKGSTLTDVDGNVFVDMTSGVGALNIGHCNPAVTKAIVTQAKMIMHEFQPTLARIEFEEKIASIAPGDLRNNTRMMFALGGSDAIEGAVKLAKYKTKQHTIVAFQGAYHGQNAGSLALSSSAKMQEGLTPLMPSVYRVPYAYCYRCAFGKEYPSCDMQCVRYIRQCFDNKHMGLTEPAAMIVEPMQGEGGYIVPPDPFLPGLQKVCKENGVLLILDEIQTGFGRTGKMFACEHTHVAPDIMVVSKSIAGGFPGFSVILARKELLENLEILVHAGTFRGNHIGCAAAVANMTFIKEKKLPERAARLGTYVMKSLKDLQEESKIVGDVRGKGLFIGIELVKNKSTKEISGDLVKKVIMKMFRRGILVFSCGDKKSTIRLMPALTIPHELLDKSLQILRDAIKEVETEV